MFISVCRTKSRGLPTLSGFPPSRSSGPANSAIRARSWRCRDRSAVRAWRRIPIFWPMVSKHLRSSRKSLWRRAAATSVSRAKPSRGFGGSAAKLRNPAAGHYAGGARLQGRPGDRRSSRHNGEADLAALRIAFPDARFRGFDAVVPQDIIHETFGLTPVATIADAFYGVASRRHCEQSSLLRGYAAVGYWRKHGATGVIFDFWNNFGAAGVELPSEVTYTGLGELGRTARERELADVRRLSGHRRHRFFGLRAGQVGLIAAGHAVRVLDDNSAGPAAICRLWRCRIEFDGEADDPKSVAVGAAGRASIALFTWLRSTAPNCFMPSPKRARCGGAGHFGRCRCSRVQRVRELVVASSSEAYQTPPMVPTPGLVPLVVPDVLEPPLFLWRRQIHQRIDRGELSEPALTGSSFSGLIMFMAPTWVGNTLSRNSPCVRQRHPVRPRPDHRFPDPG